jgi:hypothetical protein
LEDGSRFLALIELLASVLADGLEHPVAQCAARSRSGHDQRLIHQPTEKIKDVVFLDAVSRAHRLRGPQRPPSGEDG